MTGGYTISTVAPVSIEGLQDLMDKYPKPEPPSAIFLQSSLFDIMRAKPLEIESPKWDDDETLPFRVRFTDMTPIYRIPSYVKFDDGPSCIDRSLRPYRPAITAGSKLVTATVACVLGLVVAFLAFGV